jgi:hypothetical protein
MRRSVLLLGCATLAFLVCTPLRLVADPITVSLDLPNQTTARPASGVTSLSFSGTVVVESGWVMQGAFTDAAFNSAKTLFLSGPSTAHFKRSFSEWEQEPIRA